VRPTIRSGARQPLPEPPGIRHRLGVSRGHGGWTLARWLGALGLVIAPRPALSQPAGSALPLAADTAAAGGGLACTPSTAEMQTRRPIPFDCRSDGEAVRVSVRYREHAEAPWRTLELEESGDSFRATLPCEVTMNSGRLEYFIVASDAAGDPLDTLGSKNEPRELVLNPQSTVAPAYPGEEPPARCEELVLCPPDFPGCDDPEAAGRARPVARDERPVHWLGLHLAADVGFVGGSDVCTGNNPDYDCVTSGTDTPFPGPLSAAVAARPGELGDGYPGTDISTAPALGTLRVLLAYDHAVSERVSLGGRLGYAFGGGPILDGDDFLPVHIEAKVAFWPSGAWSTSVNPYFHIGAGIAEVDLKESDLSVKDCTEATGRQLFLDCIAASGDYAPENDPELPVRTLDAYRRLGAAFVTAGGGLLVPLGGRTALQANLNLMLMMPSVGVVLQPSLGFVYGL
jgi:hypothetical protein